MITAQGLQKNFGSVAALEDVTVTLGSGATALLGRNGAGKTTLINVISGIVLATHGTTTVDGHPAGSQPAVDLISRQMDLSTTANHLTASRLERLMMLTPDERDRFRRILGQLGVPDKNFGKMSKGNQLKLALALTFARDRQILLLDEPTAGLDIFGVEILGALIEERTAAGKVTVVATHQPTLTTELFDHAVVIDNGRLLYEGDLEGLLNLAPEGPDQATPTARLAGAMLKLIGGSLL